jgi:hypothetical protein
MIYTQENISHNKFRRVFSESVDSDELKWHKDQYDRIVFIESCNGWKLQMDEELPQVLQEGQKYFIPKDTYHRVIKGTGDLKITIIEDNGKYRIPKPVMVEMKKGYIYGKKSKNINRLTTNLIEKGYVTSEELKKLKEFFDGKMKSITLNENFKGKPEQHKDYVDWLSHGGDIGYKWVISSLKRLESV